MSTIKEARQKAFKQWVEYDHRANDLEDKVSTLELAMHKAYAGIEFDTEKYRTSDLYSQLWYDWYNEYFGGIVKYTRSLGFKNGRYPITLLDFDDAKCETGLYYDYWIFEAIDVDRFFINTRSSSGTFHRFMMFEDALVKFGVVDELDENGYSKVIILIDKCIDYLDSVVSKKLLRYVKLLKYVEEKRESALRSCDSYIYNKTKETQKESFQDWR